MVFLNKVNRDMITDLLNGKKILIVEDDFSSRLYLNKLIEKTGAIILNAANGSDAVTIVTKTIDIDLILMDIQMPLMDGYESTKKIRELGRKVIIIAQTAYGLPGDREEVITSGFDDYIIKPINAEKLIEKLYSYFQIR